MNKLRRIVLVSIFVLLVLGINREIFAIEENTEKYSRQYIEYLKLSDEEKSKVAVIPRKYDISMDEFYKKQAENKIKNSFANIFGLRQTPEIQALPSSFILLKEENTDIKCEQYGEIDIKVEDQGKDGLCWAFAAIKTLETNLALKGKKYDFSERHVDYLTSKKIGGVRGELGSAGDFSDFSKYCGYGYGPVLEQDVPYDSVYAEDEYELLNIAPKVYLKDTISFPSINKKYGDVDETILTEDEIKDIRQAVKEHIIKNGGLYADICTRDPKIISLSGETYIREYNGKSVLNYNGVYNGDHAITIIGWDDEFSTENFPEDIRPKNKGAYIALNSWGSDFGDNGIFYISYEDKNVEVNMAGIIDVTEEIENTTTICFEDKALYNCIKSYIGNKSLKYDDENKRIYCTPIILDDFKTLDLSNKNISNLNGIEKFSFKQLYLNNNHLSNINQLKNMENLIVLDLSNNNISEISDIQNLEHIFKLNLSNNNITDISGLQNLSELKFLNLKNNNIMDISCLKNDSYDEVVLSNNPIEVFGEKIFSVGTCYLDDCNINDNKLIKICEKISSFNTLSVANNNITDFSCISNMHDGNTLDLSGNKNLDFEEEINIEELKLRNCNIENIEGIVDNFKGKQLDFSYNPIDDITSIADKEIKNLNISYTNVKNVSSLRNIELLNISGINDIKGLEHLTQLRALEMNNCDLNDEALSKAISRLNNLEYLSINNNNVTSLQPLNVLNSLYELYANNNQINDITGIKSIKKLYLCNNRITDISYLSTLNNLSNIDLSKNLLTDVSKIELMNNLNSIVLSDNKIEDIKNIDYYNRTTAKNIKYLININIKKDKLTKIDTTTLIKNLMIDNMYDFSYGFECENCKWNYFTRKIEIQSDTIGESQAKIKIIGWNYDGLEYIINYNTVEDINVTDIKVRNEASKKYYLENDSFDDTGLTVEITYEDRMTEETKDYMLINNNNLVAGQENVIIRSNKNPEIQTTHAIKVYGEEEIEIIQFEDTFLYSEIKSKKPFGDSEKNLKIMRYDDDNKILYIPKEDVDKIKSIKLNSPNISNINGLEKFSKLQDINLGSSVIISSLDNLVVLENLSTISLIGNKINSIENLLRKENISSINLMSFCGEHYNVNSDIIELPKYIYESVKLQDNVSIEANIEGYNNKVDEIIKIRFNEDKKVATLELDKKVTEIFQSGKGIININIIGGKTNGSKINMIVYLNMVEKKICSITLTQLPSNLSYEKGAPLNIDGIEITATYEDGTTGLIELSADKFTGYDANKLGEQTITVTYAEGITDTFKVTVIEKLYFKVNKYDEVEESGTKYIEKILPNTSIEALKRNLETNGTVEIYKNKEKITDNSSLIGTGMEIVVKLNNEERRYTVVVTGDLIGNGKMGIGDLSKLARYAAKIDTDLKGAYLRASDIVKDGKYGRISDISKMARVLAGLDNL